MTPVHPRKDGPVSPEIWNVLNIGQLFTALVYTALNKHVPLGYKAPACLEAIYIKPHPFWEQRFTILLPPKTVLLSIVPLINCLFNSGVVSLFLQSQPCPPLEVSSAHLGKFSQHLPWILAFNDCLKGGCCASMMITLNASLPRVCRKMWMIIDFLGMINVLFLIW